MEIPAGLDFHQTLSAGSVRPFVRNPNVMAMTGLPEGGEYRLTTAQLPGSALILEFIEFKGLDSVKTPVPSRVQDPGSFRLQLAASLAIFSDREWTQAP